MAELLTFSKFHSTQEAEEFINLLRANNIEFVVEQEKNSLDSIYLGQSLDPMTAVKIPSASFVWVNELLLLHAKSQLNDISPDYYLFGFSNEELIAVLQNPNEWNHLDLALAEKILTDRNVAIPDQQSLAIKSEVYTPTRLEFHWLFAEYLLSICLIYAGIVVGLVTLFAFKTLKTGQKVNMYDDSTRFHAKVMLCIGIARTHYQWMLPYFV